MLKCSTRPIFQPMLPPICSAAPSRPAEPPHRWVSTVPRKMAGTSHGVTELPSCTARSTSFVPLPTQPVALYRAVMAMPAAGRSHSSQTCSVRCSVTHSTARWNSVPMPPHSTPVHTARSVHRNSARSETRIASL